MLSLDRHTPCIAFRFRLHPPGELEGVFEEGGRSLAEKKPGIDNPANLTSPFVFRLNAHVLHKATSEKKVEQVSSFASAVTVDHCQTQEKEGVAPLDTLCCILKLKPLAVVAVSS